MHTHSAVSLLGEQHPCTPTSCMGLCLVPLCLHLVWLCSSLQHPQKRGFSFSLCGTVGSHMQGIGMRLLFIYSMSICYVSPCRNHSPASLLFRDNKFSILRIGVLGWAHIPSLVPALNMLCAPLREQQWELQADPACPHGHDHESVYKCLWSPPSYFQFG